MHQVRITSLAWYICGVSALLVITCSAISIHPDAEWLVGPTLGGLLCMALVAAGFAMMASRKPAAHWIHHSKAAYIVTAAMAVIVTLLLIAIL